MGAKLPKIGGPLCWLPGSLVDQSLYGGLLLSRDAYPIMCVLMVKLLCQAVMGPSTRVSVARHVWVSGIKWHDFPRILALGSLTQYWKKPQAWLSGMRVRAELGHSVDL
jgi:hypothetical protein